MSFYSGTQSEILFSNGFAYATANANVSTAQSLITSASGKFQQPVFPGLFFQTGRTGQVVSVDFAVTLNTSGTPTVIFTAGLATAQNNVSGTTIVANQAFNTSTWTNGVAMGRILISCFGAGYGTSSVSTNLWSTMSVIANSGAAAGGVAAAGGPTNVTTIDNTVNQWLYLTVTFSAASASNTAVLQQLAVSGLN